MQIVVLFTYYGPTQGPGHLTETLSLTDLPLVVNIEAIDKEVKDQIQSILKTVSGFTGHLDTAPIRKCILEFQGHLDRIFSSYVTSTARRP